MTRKITFIIFLLFPLLNLAQDSVTYSGYKGQVAIHVSCSYKNFYGKKYIQPTPLNGSDRFEDHQFEKFTKIPNFGYSCGLIFSHRIFKNWNIGTGVQYSLKKDIYENHEDTTLKNIGPSNTRTIFQVFQYYYCYYKVELPLFIQFMHKKYSFCTGINFTLLSYRSAKYTYLIDPSKSNPIAVYTVSEKTFNRYVTPDLIFPFLQVSYNIRIAKLDLYPFLAFEHIPDMQKSFYVLGGVIFPLIRI
jgi:hypothetical protein